VIKVEKILRFFVVGFVGLVGKDKKRIKRE